MQLAMVTMQLSAPGATRHMRLARPVRALSGSSAYMGRRLQRNSVQGAPPLPARRRAAAAQPVRASFFGVGAPEAILVGVVALVVFGPKGLAQAAKSLGATLRSFAPTIRELTSVSQELKSTLENEIGINEIKEELQRPATPTPRPPKTDAAPYAGSSGDEAAAAATQQQGAALGELADSMAAAGQRVDDSMAAVIDPDIERKRAEAAAAAWGGAAPAAAPAQPAAPAAAAPAAAAAGAAAATPKPRAVEAMSLDELEAELAKRKAAVAAGQLPKQLSADDA